MLAPTAHQSVAGSIKCPDVTGETKLCAITSVEHSMSIVPNAADTPSNWAKSDPLSAVAVEKRSSVLVR